MIYLAFLSLSWLNYVLIAEYLNYHKRVTSAGKGCNQFQLRAPLNTISVKFNLDRESIKDKRH